MNRVVVLLVAVGCGGPARPVTAPASNHAPAAVKLGPTIAKADFDHRVATHQLWTLEAERLQDEGGNVGPMPDGPRVRVAGDVISALGCRPGGSEPSFVSDGHFAYMTEHSTKLSIPPAMAGMPTPSTYCSFERFRIPHELEFAGELDVR